MRAAAVFPDKKTLGVVRDFPQPKLVGPSDVKLRILNVGVCGTDREIASWEYGSPPSGFEYLVIGHETVGEIVEVGPEVQGLKPGDIAIPMVRRPCSRPDCFACRHGRQDFCQTGEFRERGIKELHGFMTEMIVDEAQYLSPVPGEIRNVAVLVEPLTIASKAVIQVLEVQRRLPWGITNSGPQPGSPPHHALILGAGPVGLLGAMTFKLAGFDVTVYSKDRAPNQASAIVEAIGAKYMSSQDVSVEQMAKQVGNIDLVYEATGASQLSFDVLTVLGTNGLFVLTGIPGKSRHIEIDGDTIMRNMVLENQVLLGTVNAGKDAFERAVSDLRAAYGKWPDAVNGLITGRFPIEDFAQPVLHASGIKNVIEIAR